MKSDPGTYVFVTRSRTSAKIQIGRRGCLDIRAGYYLYVGSAFGPGGVLARVSRHWRERKAKRWHIDYLREWATPVSAWCCYDTDHLEHRWAQALAKFPGIIPAKGFGCSDCNCESHLFFTPRKPVFSVYARVLEGAIKPAQYS